MKVSYEKEGRDMTYVHRETLGFGSACGFRMILLRFLRV